MIVLSLFDGMACGYEALKRAGIPIKAYYASEIDKYAIQVAKKNHPDIIHLGDINNYASWDIPKPDLIMGGSPCQGFSFAGKQLAFDDPRSRLFFTMMDIIEYYQPTFRLLENVKMKKEYLDIITSYFKTEPHFINSALVSAQNRQRYYWYNWDAPDPDDKGILLRDILQHGITDREKAYALTARYYKSGNGNINRYANKSSDQLIFEIYGLSDTCIKKFERNGVKFIDKNTEKAKVLTAGDYQKLGKYGNYLQDIIRPASIVGRRLNEKTGCLTTVEKDNLLSDMPPGRYPNAYNDPEIRYRKLTPIECERLQTLPDNYTEGVSNTQRYKMLGNGWTVDVIAHIFKHLPALRRLT